MTDVNLHFIFDQLLLVESSSKYELETVFARSSVGLLLPLFLLLFVLLLHELLKERLWRVVFRNDLAVVITILIDMIFHHL